MSAKTRKLRRTKMVKFGYGVVGPTGKPYWDEGCVCENKGILNAEIVCHLNRELPKAERFKEVALYWRGTR